ncbi:MAG: hypothetical protein ACT4PP_03685 [Sporichthyaceae bacterium]
MFAPFVDGPGDLRTVVLAGGPAVSTVHSGGPDSLSLAYLALFAEIERAGGTPLGPVIEDYLPPGETRTEEPAATTAGIRLSILFAPDPLPPPTPQLARGYAAEPVQPHVADFADLSIDGLAAADLDW